MRDEHEKRIKVKLQYFYENQIKVHVKRYDGLFWNGIITTKLNEDVWSFEDAVLGNKTLFSIEIQDVVEFTPPGSKL